MVFLENGKIIKSKAKAAIFTQMDKSTMDSGHVIKNLEVVLINTRTVIFISEDGKMIGDQVREK
jgi:hypothetical protein